MKKLLQEFIHEKFIRIFLKLLALINSIEIWFFELLKYLR